jgi:hypothetical protein
VLLEWLADITQAQPPSFDWQAWLDLLLGPLGLTIFALIVVVAFLREWVVPGTRYRRDTDDLRLLLNEALDKFGDVAKATEERNRNEQARLDILRGSSGLAGDLKEAEDQIARRRSGW